MISMAPEALASGRYKDLKLTESNSNSKTK
jgi:hypothetical protein